MATRITADVAVQNFGLAVADDGLRLDFPTMTIGPMTGSAGAMRWTIGGGTFTGLTARIRTGQWQASSGQLTGVMLRGPDDGVALDIATVELPDGAMIAPGPDGMELRAPTARLCGVTVATKGGVAPPRAPIAVVTPAPVVTTPGLRQGELRFLDGLAGEIALTVKVQLDLPVIGVRTLDQKLRVPIERGSLNFRALDRGLDWLEGTFLDISVENGRLGVSWGVPIVVPQREILSWALDEDAKALTKSDRVPVRSFVDFRIAGDRTSGKLDVKPAKPAKRGVVRALTLDDIAVKLSLNAPRSVAVGDGHILFGGDDAAGMLDLEVTGALGDGDRPGALRGSIGALDLTIADLALGDAAVVSIDRVRLGQVDPIELRFTGFAVAGVVATVAEIYASNLKLRLG